MEQEAIQSFKTADLSRWTVKLEIINSVMHSHFLWVNIFGF